MERHLDEVMAEHPVEEEKVSKKDGGGGRGVGSGKVSANGPGRAAVENGRGIRAELQAARCRWTTREGWCSTRSVTEGTVKSVRSLESQVEAVRELSGRDPALVTADSGYAYSKVYAALERRGVAAPHPGEERTHAEPSIPLRLFRYDARHDIVKCPRGKTLSPQPARKGRALLSFEDA